MTNTAQIYKAKVASPYSDEDAQIIGESLDELKDKFAGELRPQHIVESAKWTRSPLHNYFDWDNESAAEKHRIDQARQMVRSIFLVVETPEGPRETRAFVSVTSNIEDGKRYVDVATALTTKDYRSQIIDEALRAVKTWRAKYRDYKELTPIFKAIDDMEED